MFTYPKDVITILIQKWQALDKSVYGNPSPLPKKEELEILIDVAFHATFLTEEGRRPGFRVVYYTPKDYEQDSKHNLTHEYYFGGHRLVRLDTHRTFSVSEVNRLSPAADLTRQILCVANFSRKSSKPIFSIWAVLDVGENWWQFIHHETGGGRPPPSHLTITSYNPGELLFSVGGRVILTLKSGQLFEPTDNALWEGPVSDFFDNARHQLYKDTNRVLTSSKYDPKGQDDEYPFRFYNFFLERILFNIRSGQHGGSVIIIPSFIKKHDTRLTDRINIKYQCSYDYVWDLMVRKLANHRKYYDLLFPLWHGKKKATKTLFQEFHLLEDEKQELDEALSDISQTVASLASIDGAVVINDKYVVIGFGAEVIAPSPSLKDVIIITTPTNRRADIQSYGTRHRSAFRFASSLEQSVVFVISSDGGVKAVKRNGREVYLWPDINTGSLGL